MQEKEIIEVLKYDLAKVKNAISCVNSAESYSYSSVTTTECGYAISYLREVERHLTKLINELSKEAECDKDISNEEMSM